MATVAIQKYRGCLLGLAVGDALGAPIEMKEPGTFALVSDMIGGGYFNLAPGEWTDDTALALCSAESLIRRGKFDPHDHLSRFLRWYRHGYMSTRPEAFGIGLVTAGALMRFESTGEDFCGPTGEHTPHNGSLMHLAPVPLVYANNPVEGIRLAGEVSRLTHGARDAVDACRYLAALIIGAVHGYDKAVLLSPLFDAVAPGIWSQAPLSPVITHIAELTDGREPPTIDRINYADASTALRAALWAFSTTDMFKDGLLAAVNLGWDADTMGAVYGQLAGAYYGEAHIPLEWQQKVAKSRFIISLADQLHTLTTQGAR